MFHLAIPTHNLQDSKEFYAEKLELKLGRESDQFVIVNFFEHQLVCHLSPEQCDKDPKMYPRHFGFIVDNEQEYESLLKNAIKNQCDFFKEDFDRWKGKEEEHRSFFLKDPSNNLIEFKWYKNQSQVF